VEGEADAGSFQVKGAACFDKLEQLSKRETSSSGWSRNWSSRLADIDVA